jgi:hypothetical protein
MLHHQKLVEENINVKQMAKESLVGILSGIVASILVVFVGVMALKKETNEFMTNGFYLYLWLLFLTALCVGQFVLSWILITYWDQSPKQVDGLKVN